MAEGERRLADGAPPPGTASEEEIEELLRTKLAARQVYQIRTYPEARAEITALPTAAALGYAETLA